MTIKEVLHATVQVRVSGSGCAADGVYTLSDKAHNEKSEFVHESTTQHSIVWDDAWVLMQRGQKGTQLCVSVEPYDARSPCDVTAWKHAGHSDNLTLPSMRVEQEATVAHMLMERREMRSKHAVISTEASTLRRRNTQLFYVAVDSAAGGSSMHKSAVRIQHAFRAHARRCRAACDIQSALRAWQQHNIWQRIHLIDQPQAKPRPLQASPHCVLSPGLAGPDQAVAAVP